MTAKFTSHPWLPVGRWVETARDDVADICNCDPASMGQERLGRTDEEIAANVRLIAAAPHLYHTLMSIVEVFGEDWIEAQKDVRISVCFSRAIDALSAANPDWRNS